MARGGSAEAGRGEVMDSETQDAAEDVVCSQCNEPSKCTYCHGGISSPRVRALMERIEAKRGGHQHRCDVCMFTNIMKHLKSEGGG